MTPAQEKYLKYRVFCRETKERYKRDIMGFEHKGKLDWKTYEQFRDEVVASFPEEGIQIGKYRATLHQGGLERTLKDLGNIYFLPRRKSIVLHTYKKGEKPCQEQAK